MPPVFGKALHMLSNTPFKPMEDPFGRTFKYLRLSVTDLCNYRCNYCLPEGFGCESKAHSLSIDQIHTLVTAFAQNGIEKVRITGGEPALRRDLPDVISAIKSVKGIDTVALTTNGHQLQRNVQSWADAGLDAINISCDSLDPRLFNAIVGRNKLSELLQGIDATLNTAIAKVKVNTVLLKQYNLHQLDDLINWASDTRMSLRFIELMQTGDNGDYFKENHVSCDVIEQQLLATGWLEQQKADTAGPAREFAHPLKKGKVGFIAPYSKDFCKTCNRLRVSSLGKLHLCLFGDGGHDLSDYLTRNDSQGLAEYLPSLLGAKPLAHRLHQHNSGSTAHLASIGG